ncbi:MAG: IS3 family transposase, partial [Crocinitomicaceae bacterium]|nr:IS3 family transposase [Flavobacteriales bacterium]NQZ36583.1 IS3 family transposase [Crocinitomicaceae bacterium]
FRKHKNSVAELPIVRPEQVWVSDITYIGNRTNPIYLALITDAYSKKIVGHDVSNSLCTKGTLRALSMAAKSRSYKREALIHHSDRGFQYCSNEYQKLLSNKKIKCSMTESYDPYANAVAERVNGILKQEFLGYDRKLSISIMKQLVKDSVRIYNTIRPHYSCHLLTPKQMHRQRELKMRTYKNKNSVENVLNTV